MLPYVKLALVFSKLAKQHGHKVLHGGNIDLLTKDLGDALRRQKKLITDPDMGTIETAYEALPVIAEVKILTVAVAKKLDIDTKGKSATTVLEDIVAATEARNSKAADEIKNSLAWTRTFFAHPEIQEIMSAELIAIEKPRGLGDLGGFGRAAQQSAQRAMQELARLQKFLSTAKNLKTPPKNDNNGPSGPAV